MSTEQNIDRQFREHLTNAEVQPPALVWTGVEQELKRKKRRGIAWWSLLSVGLLAGVLSLLWIVLGHDKQPEIPPATTGSHPITEATTPSSASENVPILEPPVAKTSGIQALAHTAVTTPGTVTEVNTAHTTIKYTATAPKSAAVSATISPTELPASIAPESTESVIQNTVISAAVSASISPAEPAIQNTVTLGNQNLRILPHHSPILFSITPVAKWRPVPVKVQPKKINQVDTKCYDFRDHDNVWLLEAYTGPLNTQKTLSVSIDGPENEIYRRRRLETESNGWGFHSGVRASYLFQSHYSLGTGIDYKQFTEVARYKDLVSIDYTIKQRIDVNTGKIVIDTVDVNFGIEETVKYNRFGLLDIPFQAGYEWRNGRTGVHLRAGGAINLVFWKRGFIIDPIQDDPVKFDGVFKANAGLSLQASAQFFWHIQPRTRLFAEPFYQMILQPITVANQPVQQNSRLIGLRLGITKIL